MGMKLVEGRDFSRQVKSDTAAIIVNQKFVNEFNIVSPIGKIINERTKIIGVVEDFHYSSLKNEIEPVIHPFGSRNGLRTLLVKIPTHNIGKTISILEDNWKKIQPDKPFVYSFLNTYLERSYREDKRWNSIVFYSSIFVILVTCMGLIGITALTISRRIKEIGIRKILGASVPQIGNLLIKEFLILLIISNVLAWPVTYYFMNKWLQNYAYKTSIDVWIFLLAGILSGIITIVTISFQVFKTAHANPADSLRYE
ncbi:ABC transporter permease, partial [candidate division KSB1 bacterium]